VAPDKVLDVIKLSAEGYARNFALNDSLRKQGDGLRAVTSKETGLRGNTAA
jgi:hypothetical protein